MTQNGVGGDHDDRSDNTPGSSRRCSSLEFDEVSVSTNSDTETVKSQLCCLQGCLATSAVGLSFFLGLPSGILLVFYASKNDDVTLLAVGGVLIVLPVLTLLAFVLICLYRQRLKKMTRNRVESTTDIQKQVELEYSKY